MKKSFIVIGLGRFGLSVVNQLAKQTNQLIAVDVDEKRVDLIKGEVEQCFCCDCTNKNVLEELILLVRVFIKLMMWLLQKLIKCLLTKEEIQIRELIKFWEK